MVMIPGDDVDKGLIGSEGRIKEEGEVITTMAIDTKRVDNHLPGSIHSIHCVFAPLLQVFVTVHRDKYS